MLSLFCLKLGCQHTRLENFCATGVLTPFPLCRKCGNACPVCTGEHDETFLPVSKQGVSLFLTREKGIQNATSVDQLISLVWKNDHWTKRIFDLKVYQTRKYHVEAMLLQLIAVRFLVAQCDDDAIKWTLGEEQTDEEYPPYAFMIDGN